MSGTSRFFLGALLLLLSTQASCFTAWWTEVSPHIAMQDPTTGNISYSACNSNSTPIFPTDGSNFFEFQRKPRNGTAIAAAGWYDADKAATAASIFMQDVNGTIVNGYFECNMATGRYDIKGEFAISATAGVDSVHNNTGLAVELLGPVNGYRLFYHDKDRTVNYMYYTASAGGWFDVGRISQEPVPGMFLASMHSGSFNMTVVFPKDDNNFETSRFFKDQSWHLDTVPHPLADSTANSSTDAADILLDPSIQPNFTLPGYASNLTGVGTAIDKGYVRSIFYLGNDRQLHQVSNINWQWRLMTNQSERIWPIADIPGGPMASTYNYETSEIWLWYKSNGSLAQIYYSTDRIWTEATVVPSFNATKPAAEDPTGTGTPKGSSTATAKPAALSAGAKAGIGIGVSAGVLALAGAVLFFFFARRRRQRAAAAEAARLKEAESVSRMTSFNTGGVGPYTEYGNLSWGSDGPKEKHGEEVLEADAVDTTAPQELTGLGERYELVGEGHWREMDATGQNGARRSIGGWREAQEERKK